MRRFLVIAWAVLAVAGYGLTVLMDEPREITSPAGRVAPQEPSPPALPPSDLGCPSRADEDEGTAVGCVVVMTED